jgi:hypothetical protein
MAELYWEAFLRDVPFTDYNVNPVVQQACDDLTRMSGYRGPRDASGRVTPQLLFRYDFPGALDGPITSQILYRRFFYDGIEVVPQMRTRQPMPNWNPDRTFSFDPLGRDFLTAFNEWLRAQNGMALGNVDVFGPNRFIRSVRDMGRLAGSDAIDSVYRRAALVLGGLGADDGNPYKNNARQGGFATFGLAHLNNLIGSVHNVAGVHGPPLTIGGELNKLAHNLSEGRNMSGVHWRVSDNINSLFQGEEVAIRILREEKATYPEPNATFTLTKFNGQTITI